VSCRTIRPAVIGISLLIPWVAKWYVRRLVAPHRSLLSRVARPRQLHAPAHRPLEHRAIGFRRCYLSDGLYGGCGDTMGTHRPLETSPTPWRQMSFERDVSHCIHPLLCPLSDAPRGGGTAIMTPLEDAKRAQRTGRRQLRPKTLLIPPRNRFSPPSNHTLSYLSPPPSPATR
jgi:hypothetical protein